MIKTSKLQKVLLTCTAYAAATALVIGGTVSYLADSDSDVNVMDTGSVYIEQHEYQRATNEDGTYKTDTVDDQTSYVLEDFEQAKPLLPATESTNNGAGPWDDTTVRMSQVGSYGGMQVFTSKNAQDKFVTVENTGETDAYVRTLVAIECGTGDSSLIGSSYHQTWTEREIGEIEVGGNNYYLFEYVYNGAADVRHENGILPAGETTYPNLSQVYLNAKTTNEDCEALDGNGNGTLDILVLSQAVQAAEWDNAAAALNTAFGLITTENHPWKENAPVIPTVVSNTEELIAAIDNAEDGDAIYLKAGKYETALNLQEKSLTILGAGKEKTFIVGPKDYTTTNIPKQTWAGWGGQQDANVYALISAGKDVTVKDLTVQADPAQIGEVAEFRHESAYAFVGIHVQSANAVIENVDIKGIKPDTVTGNDHHNFGLYITSNNDSTYAVTYKNGTVSDVNRGGIYCWGNKYTLAFENVTVIGPGNIDHPNGTLTPAAGSDKYIYAFAPFYVESSTTYKDVVVKDSYRVSWGGANWNEWGANNWATNPPAGVTCINCGIAD